MISVPVALSPAELVYLLRLVYGSCVFRAAVCTKLNAAKSSSFPRMQASRPTGQTKTNRPVTSAEAGGSGDAFAALQHFSRLSVDRANQMCPGPSIPVPRSPLLISKAIQLIPYLVNSSRGCCRPPRDRRARRPVKSRWAENSTSCPPPPSGRNEATTGPARR